MMDSKRRTGTPLEHLLDATVQIGADEDAESAVERIVGAIEEGNDRLAVFVDDAGVYLRMAVDALDITHYRIEITTNPNVPLPPLLKHLIGRLEAERFARTFHRLPRLMPASISAAMVAAPESAGVREPPPAAQETPSPVMPLPILTNDEREKVASRLATEQVSHLTDPLDEFEAWTKAREEILNKLKIDGLPLAVGAR